MASKLSDTPQLKPVETEMEENMLFGLQTFQTENESRRVIIEILKQTRGALNWNGPDDMGNRFNWHEDRPLNDWNGMAHGHGIQKRIVVDRSGMITKLFLNYLGLRGMLPDCIGNLTSLTILDVSNNRLTRLPDSIRNLRSLTHLDVSNNQLTPAVSDYFGRLGIKNFVDPNTSFSSRPQDQDEVKQLFGRDGLNIIV